MNKRLCMLFEIPLYTCLIYFGCEISYTNLFKFFGFVPPKIIYVLPLLITPLCYFIVCFFYNHHHIKTYCQAYYLSGVFHAYLVQLFLCSLIYSIINYVVRIPFFIGFFMIIICPFFINAYAVYNSGHIRIKNLAFEYKNFPSNKKIVQLSDLHLGAVYQTQFVQEIVDKIKKISPDIVVITGDLADGSLKFDPKWILPFNQLNIPILFISGNHEEISGKEYVLKSVSEYTKIKYIGNQTYLWNNINFIGVDYETNLRDFLVQLKPKENESIPNILLYHVPELYPKELSQYNIFLHLAGHTHAGQIFPVHVPTYFLNACFQGLYPNDANNCFVYVNSGVGTAWVTVRTLSYSEITVITIKGKK